MDRLSAIQPPAEVGVAIRNAGPAALASALQASRRDTLATFAVFEAALEERSIAVPPQPELNLPDWELGHIGWFQTHWLALNPQWRLGAAADPDAARPLHAPDALYDSSRVPHATRWALPLPDAAATRTALEAQLQSTLALLHGAGSDDASLYFFRLVLLHEDMHHEASLYMAQSLGLPIADERWQPAPLTGERRALAFEAGAWRLGSEGGGFAFDNEIGAHTIALPAGEIDDRVLSWDDYLPFVESGGYGQPQWWTDAGQQWLAATQLTAPRYLRREGRIWQQQRWGRWQTLDRREPACHLGAHEAAAWCAWAGRRLPTEGEWERAAMSRPEDFAWGAVWEWTASEFTPYPGFAPHPYREYSAPWFDGRPVLRGASFGSQPRLHHPRYRNYFPAGRNDLFAGFRSCAR